MLRMDHIVSFHRANEEKSGKSTSVRQMVKSIKFTSFFCSLDSHYKYEPSTHSSRKWLINSKTSNYFRQHYLVINNFLLTFCFRIVEKKSKRQNLLNWNKWIEQRGSWRYALRIAPGDWLTSSVKYKTQFPRELNLNSFSSFF